MEIENGRIAKRQREGEVDPSAEPPLVRSKIWFKDGNIVLQAGRTQFKVYQGLLAESSAVFADLFSVPQPPVTEAELVEGCAVVNLADSVVDVTFVLEALFQRRYATVREPIPIETVAAFVRMGNKYQINDLLKDGVRRLCYEFPDTLADYDETDDWSTIISRNGVMTDVVNLAREQNILSVLPAALYGYINSNYITEMDIHSTHGLSLIDERTLSKASLPLLRLEGETAFSWLTSDSPPGCLTLDECTQARNRVIRSSFFPIPNWHGLSSWKDVWEDSMCDVCVAKAQELHAAGRQQFWDQFPPLLGLPGWDELRKEKISLEEGLYVDHYVVRALSDHIMLLPQLKSTAHAPVTTSLMRSMVAST
ncbi:hypothetical protein HWV62_15881 [Athelia sp. TMB]|nr:hypothetical protein HWV62_15881 [Athelia sp. TMB]